VAHDTEPHRGQQSLGATPERLEEAVDAIAGRLDPLDAGMSAERGGDSVDAREARPFDHQSLGQVLVLPHRQRVEVEREHHDGAARDTSQLGQARRRRLPVMDRDAGHRRVDARRDSRIRAPVTRVAASVLLVVDMRHGRDATRMALKQHASMARTRRDGRSR
jgi:hypothetical protein